MGTYILRRLCFLVGEIALNQLNYLDVNVFNELKRRNYLRQAHNQENLRKNVNEKKFATRWLCVIVFQILSFNSKNHSSSVLYPAFFVLAFVDVLYVCLCQFCVFPVKEFLVYSFLRIFTLLGAGRPSWRRRRRRRRRRRNGPRSCVPPPSAPPWVID